MIPLECYASILQLFLYNFLPIFLPIFLYAFIGISLEIVGGMGCGICWWCYGLVVVGNCWYIIDTTAVTAEVETADSLQTKIP